MRTLAALVLLVSLAACDQRQVAQTYPPQYELNFMTACQAQRVSAAFCTCTWEKIEHEISPADFAAFERLPPNEQATHPFQGQIERYAEECRNEVAPDPEEPPAP